MLFHLAFMGQAVVKDLDHLKQRSPEGTGLEIALRLGETPPERQASARTREIDKYFTADSDPSQEEAVMEARSAPGLVVEGPPGTGKSQTIVNIVGELIRPRKVSARNLPEAGGARRSTETSRTRKARRADRDAHRYQPRP